MNSNDIRNSFINYFKKQSHTYIKSSPVIPLDDPTLLFTNAGMNQFKDIFLGKSSAEYKKVTDYQKCIRAGGKHNDLDEVGKDNFHHTFFEMLGNWSFGDYFKEKAIFYAWDLLTKVWELPKEKLYVTVHHTDDESYHLWHKVASLPYEKIIKFGDKDNFWEMANVGPCGINSEINIDLGEEASKYCNHPGKKCGINVDGCSRFIELWNLVFIQYNRKEDGTLKPLENKHVDTGMGFERIVRVITGKSSNYEIDIFKNIISNIEKETKKEANSKNIIAFRVIADHIRALTFAITDGAIISNEGRNSVLRSILRRAARFGRTILEQHEPFIYKITESVVNSMGEAYPEIMERKDFVKKTILEEEIAFNKTIEKGLEYFEKISSLVIKQDKKIIHGKDVFILHTQEGFPMDLTRQMAEEKGLSIDENEFFEYIEEHKIASKDDSKFKVTNTNIEWKIFEDGKISEFIGYNNYESNSKICKYGWDSNYTQIILDKTPFYANMGGQVGDKGIILIDENQYSIADTIKFGDDIVHIVDTKSEINIKNEKVYLKIDEKRRKGIARNHTATHLLHKVLREVLGKHITQQGSLVEHDRFRFDFNHKNKLEQQQIYEIEEIINSKIIEGISVNTVTMPIDDAKKMGAMSLFGEKYSEKVRVVSIGNFSKELCGGTHLNNTIDIGYFRILSESSIASGIRRIEAITGIAALKLIDKEKKAIKILKNLLNTNTPEETYKKVDNIVQRIKELEKENKKLKIGKHNNGIDNILNNTIVIDDINLVVWKANNNTEADELRVIGDKIRNKIKSCVLVLASIINDKINYVCMVTDNLIKSRNLKAGEIIKEVAKIAGGGGGGKPSQATAGARDISKLDESLNATKNIIEKLLVK